MLKNGDLIKINDYGYSLVFFFTNSCGICNEVKPAFNYLSKSIRGIKFAYMDIEQNDWDVHSLSLKSRTPITYVPFLLLYINGHPIAQFFQDEEHPENNIAKMQKFLIDNTSRRQNNTTQTNQQTQSNIPAYSIGIPGNLASRRVCMLYNNAYSK
jgi:thiol-disulfide isomerase/thioredoxin